MRILEGDQPSIEPVPGSRLAERSAELRGALRRYFGRAGVEPADQDDLVQEVFLRIVKRGQIEQLDDLDAYIFATAASVVRDRHRRRGVRLASSHVSFDPDRHAELEEPAEAQLLAREALRRTSLVIMEMPERQRDVFILRRMEGMSFREISVRLGITISATEKLMARATRHLFSRMGDDA